MVTKTDAKPNCLAGLGVAARQMLRKQQSAEWEGQPGVTHTGPFPSTGFLFFTAVLLHCRALRTDATIRLYWRLTASD